MVIIPYYFPIRTFWIFE